MKKEVLENTPQEIKSNTIDVDWKDKYIRACADLENFKKRAIKSQEESQIVIKTKMMESILDMDNDIYLALRSYVDPPDGVVLILNKLKSFLYNQGIEEIQTNTYDENLHDVVSVLMGKQDGIISVVSKGYRMGEKIIRYPKVILGKMDDDQKNL